MLDWEDHERSQRSLERRLKDARIGRFKPMADFDWSWPTRCDRAAIDALFAEEQPRRLITQLKGRDDDAPVKVADAAYWMKGCSSLGRLRYAVMLRIGDGEKSSLCLIDVKEAVKVVHEEFSLSPSKEN